MSEEGEAVGLAEAYERVLRSDSVETLHHAIVRSVDQALDECGVIERAHLTGEEIDWDAFPFFNGLPPRYRHLYTPQFLKRFVVCLVTTTDKLSDPRRVRSRMFSCVAEELAAHLVIEAAERSMVEQGRPAEEAGFDSLRDLIFEDVDYEWLYRPEMDGMERDVEMESDLGFANLAPERWFVPFAEQTVHPYATEPVPAGDDQLNETSLG